MLDLQERTTKPAAPAKLWRNWYRVHKRMGVTKRVGFWNPGVTRGPDLFPSKEIAEQHALDFIAWCAPECRSWFDYIGAFPEGKAPGAP
jgi:hypothetical protein